MNFEKEEKRFRETYVDLLIEYAKKDDRIVTVEADLSNAAGTKRFTKEVPGRTVECGVQEANMIGVAAGMSAMGKIPFTHTFGTFATRRVCDQATLSVAYAGLNVKMCGSDPGVTAELNGGTHMPTEDISIMRNIPGMIIYEPVDSVQLREIFPQILETKSPVYIRLFRKEATKIFKEGTKFTLGKGTVVSEGKDVTLFASGIEVEQALLAQEELAKENISAEVINLHTIKPIDSELILQSVKKTGCAVTCENHSVIGGLGSAVMEVLSENAPAPVKRIGFQDRFGQVGKMDYLMKEYNLLAEDIVKAAKEAIRMKGEN
ncbi:MAG: transketolase family protein [Lachnospiraceae bacterium]|jgi:transketolase|nr:transketolase family protein [Lachnospiraceae bacterium]MCI1727136.1 transketolase family protein [Lachnospiraceae bacterium]